MNKAERQKWEETYNDIRLQLASWGGQAHGYLHAHGTKASLDIAEHLNDALSRLIKLDPPSARASESSPPQPDQVLLTALQGMLELERYTHRLPETVNQEWVAGIVFDAKEAVEAALLRAAATAPSAPPTPVSDSESLRANLKESFRKLDEKYGKAWREVVAGMLAPSAPQPSVQGVTYLTCGHCHRETMYRTEDVRKVLDESEAAPSAPPATHCALCKKSMPDPMKHWSECTGAPTATDWMRQVWEQGRDAAAQVADRYDCLIAHNIRVLEYAGEHRRGREQKGANRMSNKPAQNTDRELWRKTDDYYSPSLHVTEGGGIGINVGGTVFVKPIEEWHALASRPSTPVAAQGQPIKYEAQKHCCSVCNAKKLCHVCGAQTLYACSDCAIDLHATVYVCAQMDCRDAHERKCP